MTFEAETFQKIWNALRKETETKIGYDDPTPCFQHQFEELDQDDEDVELWAIKFLMLGFTDEVRDELRRLYEENEERQYQNHMLDKDD